MGNNSRADSSLSVGALGANLLLRLIQLYGIIGLPLIYRLGSSQMELHLGILQSKGNIQVSQLIRSQGRQLQRQIWICFFPVSYKILLAPINKGLDLAVGEQCEEF